MEFGNNELIMLKAMLTDPSKDWTLESLFKETGWDDQVHIAGSGNVLSDLKYLEINEHITNFISLGQEGKKALEFGLLESRLWNWITNQEENDQTLSNLLSSDFTRNETGPGIGLLKGLGIEISDGKFSFDNINEISESIIEVNVRIPGPGFTKILLKVTKEEFPDVTLLPSGIV